MDRTEEQQQQAEQQEAERRVLDALSDVSPHSPLPRVDAHERQRRLALSIDDLDPFW